MKITKISGCEEQSWLDGFVLPQKNVPHVAHDHESSEVNPLAPDQVDISVLASECEKIEKHASQQSTYCYNKSWNQHDISSLKEYAMACGLPEDKIVAAEYVEPKKEIKTASTKTENKTAKVQKQTATIELDDPFKIEERANTDYMNKKDWQVNNPAEKMSFNPVMSGGIIPIRGGENQNVQNAPKLAKNQNSINNPNVIEDMLNSKQMDNGERLAKEQADRQAQRQDNKKNWENEIIESMTQKDIVAKGKVFPTEMLTAQTGLSSPMSKRITEKFNPDAFEEKTAGEKIKDQNKQFITAMQRKRDDNNWEDERPDTIRGISDIFGDALKKAMNK